MKHRHHAITHHEAGRAAVCVAATPTPQRHEAITRRAGGIIHASAGVPHALAGFYHALKTPAPELAEAFRADPLGIKHSTGRNG